MANNDWYRGYGAEARLLKRQTYGGEEDWERHFLYLLPFLRDERYLRKEGRPVFVVYRPRDAPRLGEMLQRWRKLCELRGIPDPYLVYTLWEPGEEQGFLGDVAGCDAFTVKEFRMSQVAGGFLRRGAARPPESLETYEFGELVGVSKKLMTSARCDRPLYFGTFVAWDSTPRYGEKGAIVLNCRPGGFGKDLQHALTVSGDRGQDFAFVRAWNEWGEGMCLEPDEKNGHGYLEALRDARSKCGVWP